MGKSFTWPEPHIRIFALAGAFFVLTSVTVAMSRYGGGLALVWLSTALGAAGLCYLPREQWLKALAGMFLANVAATSLFSFGPRMAPAFATTNVFEIWLTAQLLLAVRPRRDWFEDVGGLSLFILIGGVAGPGITSIIGGLVASFAAPGGWLHNSLTWWAGHALGTLIAFPAFFMLGRTSKRSLRERWTPLMALEITALLATLAIVCAWTIGMARMPMLFLPTVPLLLVSFRFGRLGALTGIVIVTLVTAHSFAAGTSLTETLALDRPGKLLFLQFYIATIFMLALPVSVSLSQHRRLLEELRQRKTLVRLITDHSDDALFNLDEDGNIRFASHAGERLTGRHDLVSAPLSVIFDPLDDLLVRNTLAKAAANPGETCILERPVQRDAEQLWLEAKVCAVVAERAGDSMAGYAVTVRDVTDRKQAELDAIQASETDQLTGLPNRRALMRQLERTLAHADQRPFGVAIVDLDHFKAINDTHGHLAGDDTLRAVASVMQQLGSHSRFFARLGGEEFAIVAAQSEFERSVELCEQLRLAVADLRITSEDGVEFGITASIGLAQVAGRCTASSALHAADGLLYQAKRGGRNRTVSSRAIAAAAPPAIAAANRHAA